MIPSAARDQGAVVQTAAADDLVAVHNLTFSYTHRSIGVIPIFEALDLTVRRGETVCIVGPSGCGKSTLLNLVGGLAAAPAGTVLLAGRPATDRAVAQAIVFQSPSLMPWRNVLRNTTYGVERRREMSKAQRNDRAREMLRLAGLAGYENVHPWQLSGGMQQRVNLARALAVAPELLLLDEPFSSLDAQTREDLQQELAAICAQQQTTVLFVTHDVDEAVYLADRVVVLTSRPATVVKTVTVDLPRPRHPDIRYQRDFADYVLDVRAALGRRASHRRESTGTQEAKQ